MCVFYGDDEVLCRLVLCILSMRIEEKHNRQIVLIWWILLQNIGKKISIAVDAFKVRWGKRKSLGRNLVLTFYF